MIFSIPGGVFLDFLQLVLRPIVAVTLAVFFWTSCSWFCERLWLSHWCNYRWTLTLCDSVT